MAQTPNPNLPPTANELFKQVPFMIPTVPPPLHLVPPPPIDFRNSPPVRDQFTSPPPPIAPVLFASNTGGSNAVKWINGRPSTDTLSSSSSGVGTWRTSSSGAVRRSSSDSSWPIGDRYCNNDGGPSLDPRRGAVLVNGHWTPIGDSQEIPLVEPVPRGPGGFENPWMTKGFSFPLIYCTPEGTITVLFRNNVMVELTVDRNIRVLLAGRFSAASNARADASCIMHPQARIYQENAKVYSSFCGDKQAVIGAQGIIFSMKGMKDAYLVTSERARGTLPFPRAAVRFPELPKDATLSLFYSSKHGAHLFQECCSIAMNAKYEENANKNIVMVINGITIRQDKEGNVEVSSRPRLINLSPVNGTVSVRTHYVHMGTQESERSFIKRGVKRVHVSPCGMVVSDGNRTTSIDYNGRIVATN